MKKILLILDIDETLIYATKNCIKNKKEDFKFSDYYAYKRPFLDSFFSGIIKYFNIAIWSSASKDYVSKVVENICPDFLDLKFIWSVDKCTNIPNYRSGKVDYIKNLKKIKKLGFDISKTMIIDDSPEKVAKNYGNAIYPTPFTGNAQDDELKLLLKYLYKIKDVENVRVIEKETGRITYCKKPQQSKLNPSQYSAPYYKPNPFDSHFQF